MKSHRHATLPVAILMLLLCSSVGRAQFGFGGGIASMGEDALQAGVSLTDLASKDSVTYADVSGGIGFYGIAQLKYGLGGPIRLNADVAYAFFPAEEITVKNINVGDTSATFDVGATLIPITVGVDLVLPITFIRPYVGAQLSYTIFNRTLTYVKGDPSVNTPDVRNEWEGEDQWGVTVKAGAELAVGGVALDLGLRYNLANLFSKESGGSSMNYLQAGATLFFGDLLNRDDDEDDDDDDDEDSEERR